jgi:aspartate racemase
MKTIGLIGGTSWVSTADYYRIINELTTEHLGGINSAHIIMYSVNFTDFKALVDAGEWDKFNSEVTLRAQKLEQAGADCILLCANTMHMAADTVQQNTNIPLLHIAEVTAQDIVRKKLKKVGLLGTRFTMEKDFFKDRLKKYGIETIIPGLEAREFMHAAIFDEMGIGIFNPATKARYLQEINKLLDAGAEGIIFGCTEIPLLIPAAECSFPVFDTLELHSKSAVEFALQLKP